MKYIYKIIRISAWLLVLITLLVLISGFTPAKNFLFPNFLQFNYGLHLKFAIFGFAPLFYIHSLGGLMLLMMRHKKLNKQIYKIIIAILWTLIFLYFIYAYFAKIPVVPVANNQQNLGVGQNLILTQSEIAKHNQTNDCWMIIDNKVYNLSSYGLIHPGGSLDIANYCGKDGSGAYATKNIGVPHSSYANSLLNNFYLGQVGEAINSNMPQQIQQNYQNLLQNQGGEGELDD